MSSWVDFQAPGKIHFETDSTFKIGNWVSEFGSRSLLINIQKENQNEEELAILKNSLMKHSKGCILYDDLFGDPDTEQIDSATYFAKKSHVDVIVAFGSVDTFNTAKAVSVLATNNFFAKDLLNGEAKVKSSPLPMICVPMYPTLGEELTPGFTIIDADTGCRRYYGHDSLFPKACFYDPKIAMALTSDEAARIGGALLAYAIESILSVKTNPITTTLTLRVIDTIKKNLVNLYQNPKDESTITNMLWASAMIGSAIVSSPLSVTWSISMALSTESKLDFFYALSLILPHVMEYYLNASPNRYVNIARSLEEDVKGIAKIEAAIKAIEGVRKLYLEINLPTRLQEFDLQKHELSNIAQVASGYSQLANATRKLAKNEIESILVAAY